jgi:hypothetical protein
VDARHAYEVRKGPRTSQRGFRQSDLVERSLCPGHTLLLFGRRARLCSSQKQGHLVGRLAERARLLAHTEGAARCGPVAEGATGQPGRQPGRRPSSQQLQTPCCRGRTDNRPRIRSLQWVCLKSAGTPDVCSCAQPIAGAPYASCGRHTLVASPLDRGPLTRLRQLLTTRGSPVAPCCPRTLRRMVG